ncbi:MAG: amino acid adenylation domain-containing protein, partial [Candidatus Competibacterales bacterium]
MVVDSTHPLSHGQRDFWFIQQAAPDSFACNMALPLQFEQPLQHEPLERALEQLIARHRQLRAAFGDHDGIPFQRFSDQDQMTPVWIDAGGWDIDTLQQRLRHYTQQPFNLSKGVLAVTVFIAAPGGDLLLLNLHHIAGDAASLAIIGQELVTLYAAARGGTNPALTPLVGDYIDFIEWESQQLTGPTGRRASRYWQRQLGDEIPRLQLFGNAPRVSRRPRYQGEYCHQPLAADLVGALKTLAQRCHTTLPTLLLAAFQLLLHRFSGQTDLWIGVPTAVARNQPHFAPLVGFLVNQVMVYSHLPQDASTAFDDWLRQTGRQLFNGLRHQPYPIDALIRSQQRDSSSPFIQVSFGFESSKLLPWRFCAGDVIAIRHDLDQMAGHFDLSPTVIEMADESLLLKLRYRPELYNAKAMTQLATHYRQLLSTIVTSEHTPIQRLSIITDNEAQILRAWNQTSADYPKNQTFIDLFTHRAAQLADRVALRSDQGTLTYGELDSTSSRLARYLITCGIGPEVTVGLYLRRSPDVIISLLAILKAGGAFVPLDPDYPSQRLTFMLADANCSVVITHEALRPQLISLSGDNSEIEQKVLCIDQPTIKSTLATLAPTPLQAAERRSPVTPTTLAYILYTSGSTGQPKGVAVTLAALTSRLRHFQSITQLEPRDRLLNLTPMAFDGAIREHFLWALAGAQLVIAPAGTAEDPVKLIDQLQTQQISCLRVSPTLLQGLLQHFKQHPDTLRNSALRVLFIGGEQVTAAMVDAFAAHFAHQPLAIYAVYGSTEAQDVAIHRCDPGECDPLPMGKPVTNTQLHVVDDQLHLQPIGVPGELVVGGLQIARGYHRRPELTAQAFIDNPFDRQRINDPGEGRLYRTGDRARWRHDGTLEFLGRRDFQVKIRGMRVELGEIEATLMACPEIAQAAVVVQSNDQNQWLVAYLVPSGPGGDLETPPAVLDLAEWFDVAVIRSQLQRYLPDYMLPAGYVGLSHLPLTPSGKIDRRALPVVEATSAQAPYVAPRNETEALLATLFAELTQTPAVGINDHFFELGGHSLLAVQLTARVKEQLGLEL